MAKQLKLFKETKPQKRGPKQKRPLNVFGGHYFKNYNPSQKRPINCQKALHTVIKSSLAKGTQSLKALHNEEMVWQIISQQAAKNDIKLYSYANAGNHLHMLLRAKTRESYVKFIRAITGLIARHVLKAERGRAQNKKFWDARPFTRIVHFGRHDFHKVKKYLLRNTLETIGWIPKLERSKKLTHEWKSFWHRTCEVHW